ncbi:MAG TPA: cell division protein FtsL [Pyrinomonadaceae bacterium]
MRRLPPTQPNYAVRRERDGRALSRLALLLFCGLVLAGGFVFAAGQHFAAVRYGYESEKLRSERARLLEEQRRLLLEREAATSPMHLEAAAREIGLQPVQPAQVNTRQSASAALPQAAMVLGGPSSLNR